MLRWGQAYIDEGAEAYEKRYDAIRIAALKARAKALGLEVVETAQATV
jgi:hypothetical protein